MMNTQFAKKEDRLAEAARNYIRTGQFREYCNIQFKLGNYSKALAFAPAVSIEFWQELSEEHVRILQEKESGDVVLKAIVANQCDKAIKQLELQEDFEDAKVVKAMQLTGVFKSVLKKIKSIDGSRVNSKEVLAQGQNHIKVDFCKNDP